MDLFWLREHKQSRLIIDGDARQWFSSLKVPWLPDDCVEEEAASHNESGCKSSYNMFFSTQCQDPSIKTFSKPGN